jgi:hypothetical protein
MILGFLIGGWLLMMVGYGVFFYRRRHGRIGAATAGVTYDLLNQDKRKVVELIVEDRAEAIDPESADDNPH